MNIIDITQNLRPYLTIKASNVVSTRFDTNILKINDKTYYAAYMQCVFFLPMQEYLVSGIPRDMYKRFANLINFEIESDIIGYACCKEPFAHITTTGKNGFTCKIVFGFYPFFIKQKIYIDEGTNNS